MLNPIKEIAKWQIAAGNASKPYDDFLESSFQVEEALEGFGDLYVIAEAINKEHYNTCKSNSPKDVARGIVMLSQSEIYDEDGGTGELKPLADVDRLDKACDAVVYAIGSMQKLGLDHHGITKALNIVNNANKQKLGASRDSAGKLGKPDDFVGPEAELQALLDSYK